MSSTQQLLLTAVEDSLTRRITKPLRERGHAVHSAPWDDNALELIEDTPFNAIVVGFPVAGAAMGSFLSAVRAAGSPCRHCGLILLAHPDSVTAARQFLGHGANRVVSTQDVPLGLVRHVVELLTVAPRHELRVATRIRVRLSERPLRALCQTENVSATGMLVRGFCHYPLGTAFDFELSLPGPAGLIRGAAEVSRTTNLSRERVKGFGARFVSFAGSDQRRLHSFLDAS